MGIVDSLTKTAQAMSAATSIHQHGQYLYTQLQKTKPPCTTCKKELTLNIQKNGNVNEWIRLNGTSPPGIVHIYSSAQHERTVIPNAKTGVWYTTLRFSVPGEYQVIARNGEAEATATIQINAVS